MDLLVELVQDFLIVVANRKIQQAVIYEKLEFYCCKCKRQGHTIVVCRVHQHLAIKRKVERKEVGKQGSDKEIWYEKKSANHSIVIPMEQVQNIEDYDQIVEGTSAMGSLMQGSDCAIKISMIRNDNEVQNGDVSCQDEELSPRMLLAEGDKELINLNTNALRPQDDQVPIVHCLLASLGISNSILMGTREVNPSPIVDFLMMDEDNSLAFYSGSWLWRVIVVIGWMIVILFICQNVKMNPL